MWILHMDLVLVGMYGEGVSLKVDFPWRLVKNKMFMVEIEIK